MENCCTKKSDGGKILNEEDILYSLKPLVDEYFSGECSCDGKSIIYNTYDGKTFEISVKEI